MALQDRQNWRDALRDTEGGRLDSLRRDKEFVEERLLADLMNVEEVPNSFEWADRHDVDHDIVCDVVKRLTGFAFIDSQEIKRESWSLTEEGKEVVELGSPEVRVFLSVPAGDGISVKELQTKLGNVFKIGSNHAFKRGWLEVKKPFVSRKVAEVVDNVKNDLVAIRDGQEMPAEVCKGLKDRNLIVLRTWKGYWWKKGANYAPVRRTLATDITRESMQSGAWKDEEFKPYNFRAMGMAIAGGHLHPLLKVREEFRNIFLELGFEEMPTNSFVESSFWNFDALFQPQQHPARDSHDTFFLKAPARATNLPEDYLERVRTMHVSGGHNSIGHGSDWKREEAEKNLLRTHTTAVSSRMLYKLAQEGFQPKRYFSIDRVFRNEAVDKTHLAEFHQIEGVVCDKGLTLGDLLGTIDDFFRRLGLTKLKFKPAYNPYTEPSMEIFSYFEALDKWVEIGNSGMFRPEMLLPMGLPPDVNVIAWGLGLERPTMILYNIDNIRDLFGHKVDLERIKADPICRIGIQ